MADTKVSQWKSRSGVFPQAPHTVTQNRNQTRPKCWDPNTKPRAQDNSHGYKSERPKQTQNHMLNMTRPDKTIAVSELSQNQEYTDQSDRTFLLATPLLEVKATHIHSLSLETKFETLSSYFLIL